MLVGLVASGLAAASPNNPYNGDQVNLLIKPGSRLSDEIAKNLCFYDSKLYSLGSVITMNKDVYKCQFHYDKGIIQSETVRWEITNH